MIEAVVYYSKTGFSKTYAEIIAEELNLKIYSLKDAKTNLLRNTEIIYISGLTATKIRKLGSALKYFDVKYVLATGLMDYSKEYEDTVFSTNIRIPDKFYYLPAGFDSSKLKGLEKLSMKLLKKYYENLKSDAEKQGKELLPKDQKLLDDLEKGSSNKVSKEYLDRFFKEFVK